MINLNRHIYRCGPNKNYDLSDEDLTDTDKFRKHIEPWLTAVFQSEHLSLLLGSGFTSGVAFAAGGKAANMSKCEWACKNDLKKKVDEYADQSANNCGRGAANIEDQLRAAMQLEAGLTVMGDKRAALWKTEIDKQLKCFMDSILESERAIQHAETNKKEKADDLLVSFLLSFASRTATRERLNLFTTNYDRLIEYGCDLAGLHVLDRFVGALSPVFRATRLNIDIHYNPPGIRGEPRYLEGVIRLCKIHGSIDWHWEEKELRRYAVPFGAVADHPDIPKEPSGSVMIYPNPAKDVETLSYPYAELFRDFAAAVCRPNSSLVTYGYGFGDDHVNRVLKDMLTIPSTHLVIIAWDQTTPDKEDDPFNASRQRIIRFCQDVGKSAQMSLLLGSHFGNVETLVQNYLPKPAIDQITIRKTKLEEQRGEGYKQAARGGDDEQAY
ncbi:MAG: SIR2 family protein [Deltaproteobacteria bacterium]|nr:SIR2 family protein [Deltaproteobacteria bacterium]